MKNLLLTTGILCLLCSMTTLADHHGMIKTEVATGMVAIKSQNSVKEGANKLEKILAEKGMTLFARIDHSAGAKKAEQVLRPTELLIFGNPKVGTPLMQCDQTVAIDLPQKMLFWEDEQGNSWIGYNEPAYLAKRHGIQGCDKGLKKISGALKNFSRAAAK